MTIVYFIIALSILIIVHEWGHFIVARLCGIRVEEFSIGFGPKIWGVKRRDTEYKVSLLPLGGYVKMSGDEPGGEIDKADSHAFYNKSPFSRMKVVFAGPIMNLIFCVILMPIVFMLGMKEPTYFSQVPKVEQIRGGSAATAAGIKEGDIFEKVGNDRVTNWKEFISQVSLRGGETVTFTIRRDKDDLTKTLQIDKRPENMAGFIGVEPYLYVGNEAVLDNVVKKGPADRAGLQSGDEVLEINGAPVRSWTDMATIVNGSAGNPMTIQVKRGQEKLSFNVTAEKDKASDRYIMGVRLDPDKREIPTTVVRYGFVESVKKGMEEVWRLTLMTGQVFKKLFTLQISVKSLVGPIGLATVFGDAVRSGLASFIFILSFVSLQLGFINLLPIPVLDGGHIFFFLIEMVRRKPLSAKFQNVAQRVGFALLILLIVVVSINDVLRKIRGY